MAPPSILEFIVVLLMRQAASFAVPSLSKSLHLGTKVSEDLKHVIRVAQVGDPMNHTWLPRQQRGSQNRQRGIL